jgi:hypothetical protein
LASLRNVREFMLMVPASLSLITDAFITNIAVSWSLVEAIALPPSPIASVPPSIYSVAYFATACPNLKRLKIPVDFSDKTRENSIPLTNHGLTQLSLMGGSNTPYSLWTARMLDRMFPNLRDVDISTSNGAEICELITAFHYVREESIARLEVL